MLLTDSVMQNMMSEVFAAINRKLSEKYTKIKFPTPDAKEWCVHPCVVNRLSNLTFTFPAKTAHRRAISTREVLCAKSPRDTHRRSRDARRGQTSRHRGHVSAALDTHASAAAAASYQCPTRFTTLHRASISDKTAVALFERPPQSACSSGALHCSLVQCPLLLPRRHLWLERKAKGIQTGLGAALAGAGSRGEAARPRHVIVAGICSHSCHAFTYAQVEEERKESSTEAPNGGASAAQAAHQVDVGRTDSVGQVQGDVVEHAPPPPAKDTVASSRMTAPEPAPEGTSVDG